MPNFTATGAQGVVTAQFDTTSATLANVTGLVPTVAGGKTYTFEAVLFTTSPSSGGVKAAIAGTCTATSIVYECLVFNGSLLSAHTRATALAAAVGGVTAVTAAIMIIRGKITVNAGGTLAVQFAQNAASTTSSVLVGSHFNVLQREA